LLLLLLLGLLLLLLELKQRNYRELYKNACRNIRHETMIESLCICRNEAEDDAAPTADDRVFHAHAAATGQWAAIPGGGGGTRPPQYLEWGRQWDCPPMFVVFVRTLSSEEYSSTPT